MQYYHKIMVFLLKFLVTALSIVTFVRLQPYITSVSFDKICMGILVVGLLSLAAFIIMNLIKMNTPYKRKKGQKR